MTRKTTIGAWVAGSLVAATLVGCGIAGSPANTQAGPGAPGPTASQTTAVPATKPTENLPPEKAAWAAKEAADQAHNEAVAADPVLRAKAEAEKRALGAAAAKMAAEAAASPDTIHDVCQEGALPPEALPGTHSDSFATTGGWGQIVGNECVSIYVGWAGSDHPNDGAVYIIHTRDRANAPGKSGAASAWGVDGVEHLTVPGSGALTVQGVGPGGKFYLTSASGKTYTVLGQADQVMPGRA